MKRLILAMALLMLFALPALAETTSGADWYGDGSRFGDYLADNLNNCVVDHNHEYTDNVIPRFPLLILSFFVDLHKFWNRWMKAKKDRGIHYSLWTGYTLRLLLEVAGFHSISMRGTYLSKQIYARGIK